MSLQEKLNRLDDVPLEFEDAVTKSQKALYNELVALMGEFETVDGQYIANTSNLNRLDALMDSYKELFYESEYIDAVTDLANEFDAQAGINKDYFAESFKYEESEILTGILRSKKKQTMELLLEGAVDAEFFNPIKATLEENITAGASFRDSMKSIRLVVEGGEIENKQVLGRLHRYTKQIAKDSFSIYDRSYNNQVAKELDLQFYQYLGGLIGDSRKFCKRRNGKVFHEKEIEGWARLRWDGKHRSTNRKTIFTLCGGYNCNHTLIPVPNSAVPSSVIERARRNKWIG